MFIHGIDVVLFTTIETGIDEFGRPTYEPITKIVENVLPIQPTSEESANELNLTGKRISYILCIPKGNEDEWEDKEVEFFGKRFRTIGHVSQYIEDLVPGEWNKRIKVEAYE